MNLGDRLMELRKVRGLSQEEVANKLNVTRQTISKWETNQSTPDFDKIVPLCSLFEISTNELLSGKKGEAFKEIVYDRENENKKKRTTGLVSAIFLYFIAVISVIIGEEIFHLNDGLVVSIFLFIVGVATCIIIYTSIMFKEKNEEEKKDRELLEENKEFNLVKSISSLIVCVIYLLISFVTMAWHITWIIWIIYLIIIKIAELIISLRGDKNGK